MHPEERQNMIVQIVNDTGSASVKDLSIRFSITEDSIRKDLTALQKRGLLKKTYGGALKLEDEEAEQYVSQRKGKYMPDKLKIAQKAVRLLKNDEVVFLDISTTSIEIAKLLKTSGLSLTVVTNMIDVMLAMAGDEYNRLIFIGGTFSEGKDGFVGALANREISRYHFDKAFLGIGGASIERNTAMTYTSEDATTKETIMKCSRSSYMLLETRKFNKTGNFIYAALSDFSGAVLDRHLDVKQQTFFDRYGLDYI